LILDNKTENKRKFLRQVTGLATLPLFNIARPKVPKYAPPIILSTWGFGQEANKAAANALSMGMSSLDAVEAGVKIPEGDPTNTSVGYGGLPDRDGRVTLDACIMDHEGKAGSVCAMEHIKHPISVARKVMENTPHVILVGAGALDFAVTQGFEKENLLTESSRQEWEKWKITSKYAPKINVENHDTIGMLVMDTQNRIAGGCTTSGLAYKMAGRVGDSPIIGSGLYVDNEIGAATGTGLGEVVLRQCSTFLIVELMRQGYTPQKACEEAIKRIVKKNNNYKEFQVAFIAFNQKGQIGSFALQPGFSYAMYQGGTHMVVDSKSYVPA